MTLQNVFILFIESLMCFVFSDAFLSGGDRIRLIKPLTISAVSTALRIPLDMLDPAPALNIAMQILVMFLVLKLCFKRPGGYTAVVLVLYSIVLLICDLICSLLTAFTDGSSAIRSFSKTTPETGAALIISRLVLSVISVTVYLIVSRKKVSLALKCITASLLIISGLFIAAVVIFDSTRYGSTAFNGSLPLYFIVLLLLIGAILFGIVYFFDAIRRQQRFRFARQQNAMLERSLREQEQTFALWRRSVHDYKNTVLALDTMLKNGDLDSLAKYLDREKQGFMQRGEYIHSGNATVDTVLNTKYAQAADSGIAFRASAAMPQRCAVSDIHLAVIIGDLIDNAIEASLKEDEPFIDIRILTVQDFLMIKITNKCISPPADLSTTKADKQHHGIGLESVRSIAEEYGGQFELTFENSRAIAAVMIPNN